MNGLIQELIGQINLVSRAVRASVIDLNIKVAQVLPFETTETFATPLEDNTIQETPPPAVPAKTPRAPKPKPRYRVAKPGDEATAVTEFWNMTEKTRGSLRDLNAFFKSNINSETKKDIRQLGQILRTFNENIETAKSKPQLEQKNNGYRTSLIALRKALDYFKTNELFDEQTMDNIQPDSSAAPTFDPQNLSQDQVMDAITNLAQKNPNIIDNLISQLQQMAREPQSQVTPLQQGTLEDVF